MALILASQSPRRLALLKQIGVVPGMVLPADIDETPLKGELPRDYVKRVALEKAGKIAKENPNDTILAADTTVVVGRRILPKTENEQEARDCLALLSGRRHQVLTAVCVIKPGAQPKLKLNTSVVQFARLSQADIDGYITSGEWQGKAGGYAIQGAAQAFISFMRGSFSAVMGLPLYETARLLGR